MKTLTKKESLLQGLEFLLKEMSEADIYSTADLTEEHQMIKDTISDFNDEKIYPIADKIEEQAPGLNRKLMREAGDLGFLGAHMPEKYGGMQLDFVSETLIAEGMGASGSFSVSYNAHTGIGMLPILYFGTDVQKEKYLPLLASGEWVAAYCLTEPGSGSDALSAKTRADLTEDGQSYVLNGQKMWISNAGFADLFIVFAKVNGESFTGFIVESNTPGVTLGAEEKKMGIKGSSTRQVYFENATIPRENILGELGKGHLIAFNVLNIGRYKLGVSCLGGCKNLSTLSTRYANERHQFNKPIASFGAIKHKLAEQAIQAFALDAAVFRIAGFMDQDIKSRLSEGIEYGQAKLEAAEEYALECSIIKVLGSEVLDYIVDECVQVHGGMGYSEEAMASRAYRDSRINRIFEGTNEINRLLMINMLFKKAMKGEFDIATHAMAVQAELMNGAKPNDKDVDWKYPEERKSLRNFKKILFMMLGYAGQQAMSRQINLKEAQEPVMNLADIIIDVFTAESMLLKVEKEGDSNPDFEKMMKCFFYDTAQRIAKNAMDITGSIVDESMFGAFISGIRKLSKYPLQNTMALRRDIADTLITKNNYAY
ncbi:MAG: acyl-CoA dehydrogenase family protein [Bacteroidia bacterium]|nr:acyl-CoA dehydrogenase family protein [Bacteroidia bacterium]